MRTLVKFSLITVLALGLLAPGIASAADPQVEALIKEIQALKKRVMDLEGQLGQVKTKTDEAQKMATTARAGSLKASRQLEKFTKEENPGVLSELSKRVKVYGAVEAEGFWQNTDVEDGDDVSESGFAMATAEIFFEVAINKYTTGLIHFLWEDGDEAIQLDEAFISVGGAEDVPFFMMAGLIYPGIALFETHMVSDPITQNVFETQAAALELGYSHDWFRAFAGAYNSDVHQTDDAPDSHINSFYFALHFTTPEGALGDLNLAACAAYTNNIAGSGFLSENVTGSELDSLVGGYSVSLSAQYGKFALVAEYIAAVESFEAGELGFADAGDTPKPTAWNVELAFFPMDELVLALRYEGSDNLYGEEPDTQWGLAASWEFLANTFLKAEYLHGEFETDDTRDLFTMQLAVEF